MESKWIDVEEQFPAPNKYDHLSDKVKVKLSDGTITTGFFDYELKSWCYNLGEWDEMQNSFNVTHWRDLNPKP